MFYIKSAKTLNLVLSSVSRVYFTYSPKIKIVFKQLEKLIKFLIKFATPFLVFVFNYFFFTLRKLKCKIFTIGGCIMDLI